jgi:hypothetical protein
MRLWIDRLRASLGLQSVILLALAVAWIAVVLNYGVGSLVDRARSRGGNHGGGKLAVAKVEAWLLPDGSASPGRSAS